MYRFTHTIFFLAAGFSSGLLGPSKVLNESPEPIFLDGRTMGTTYRVTYFDKFGRNFKTEVDSLLRQVNSAISVYDPASEVSAFNKSAKGISLTRSHFPTSLKKALGIAQVTDGAFDPTVLPLVNAWGFGPAKNITVTKKIIDSLKSFVGYQKIRVTKDSVQKSDARVQLDFGGIGQGYGADVLAEFLRSKNISDFLVELGGEGVAAGSNLKKNSPWKIGILDPRSTQENQIVKAYVNLKNRSFTTSGNYFNYRIIDGRRYGHTLDPRTGYPVQHSLLSASVFAKDAATADAWATALMVAGHEKAILLLKRHREIDAFLIFSAAGAANRIYATPGIEKLITIDH